MATQVERARRLFTIEEYERMVETGILGPDERVERAVVWPQGPLRVPPRSMPQPDLALLRSRSYRTTGAHPDDVMLVVEVSDTPLAFDRTTKLRLYAGAGVPEYWIADTTQTSLEVYRDVVGNGYRDRLAVPSSGTIAPLHFPDVIIAVADIFA